MTQKRGKIAVIGTCGAGKSHFAGKLSRLLSVPHYELDEFYWSENWVKVPENVFRKTVTDLASENQWIVDGNYGIVRDVIWSEADTIVWLDYSFFLVMKRLIVRTLVRIFARVRIWHGNEETWARLWSKESIVLWGISTFARRRREFAQLWKSKELQDTTLLRFSDPEQAEVWLRQLEISSEQGNS